MAVADQIGPALATCRAFELRVAPARASGRHALQQLFVITDLFLVWASSLLALMLRFYESPAGDVHNAQRLSGDHLLSHAAFQLLYSVMVVLLCHAQRLYDMARTRSAFDESWAAAKAAGSAAILCASCIYLSGVRFVSRFVIVFTAVSSFVLLTGWRHLRRHRLRNALADGCSRRNLLIVGIGAQAQALRSHLQLNRQLGFVFRGFVAPQLSATGFASGQVLGSMGELRTIMRRYFIDEVVVSSPDRELVKRVARETEGMGVDVRVVPDLYDGLAWGAPIEYLGAFPSIALRQRPIPSLARLVKRSMDVILALAALPVLSPLLLAIAIGVKISSPGQLFYASERVGRKGRRFRCYKFRTMVANAEAMQPSLQHLNQRTGVLFKISDDPRITSSGRFLRKYSLDELPQFWNVLKGDMSIVGPRPPLPSEVDCYESEHLHRLDARPGITGLWQVEARRDPSFEKYFSLDVHYVEHWSLWLDLKILFKTVAVVLAGTGE